jgi:tetratricopeptide (TPR) repeat protein
MACRSSCCRVKPSAWLVVAAALAAATPAYAQTPSLPGQGPISRDRPLSTAPEAPPKKPPKPLSDPERGLDFLLGALQAAPDDASARHIESRIWALWSHTSSDTAALLMARSKTALAAGNADLAMKLLDALVKLKPDYIEGWNRRATLLYAQNDYQRALRDIEQVLRREPRHFAALAGLGMIMQDLGDDKRALAAYRKALAINPRLEKVPDLVKALAEKVEGRDI